MEVLTELDEERVRELRERDEFFWLDLLRPEPGDIDALGRALELHPIALEDTREFGQRPKVDMYEGHLLLVFYTARVRDGEGPPAEPIEVHVHLSGSSIVTVHHQDCDLLGRLHQTLADEHTDDEDYLVYQILDALTDAFYPVISALEERIDALEGEVLERTRREQLSRIYRLRQDTRELQRLAAAQRDHFPAAMSAIRTLPGHTHGSREYLRDIADHLVQIAGELQRQNDDLLALAGTYFNANSDRLNAVAARLTIIGTLFVTWTLVTGFFGQNFGWLVDNIDSKHDFLLYGLGTLIIPTVVLLGLFWIKRRDWF
jgi:magnesium transporter